MNKMSNVYTVIKSNINQLSLAFFYYPNKCLVDV